MYKGALTDYDVLICQPEVFFCEETWPNIYFHVGDRPNGAPFYKHSTVLMLHDSRRGVYSLAGFHGKYASSIANRALDSRSAMG